MALRWKAILRLLVPTAIGTREQISVRLQNPQVNTSDFSIREQIIGLNTFSTILRFNDPERILEREAIGDT